MTRKKAVELIAKYGTPKEKRCCQHTYNYYATGKDIKRHKLGDGLTLDVCQICGKKSCHKEYHHAGAGYEYETVDIPLGTEKFFVENKLQKAYDILI
jgi:hypothetical protein